MPKLPAQNISSDLEIVDKTRYSRGELTVPKAPKHHIVFKHHLKLSLVLLATCVVLGLVFVAGKSMITEKVVEEEADSGQVQPTYTDESFKGYTDDDYKNLKIDNYVWVLVEKVDVRNRVVEGYDFNNPEKKYAVKFGEKADMFWLTAPNESGTGGGERKTLEFEKTVPGTLLNVLSFEDPREHTTLTVVTAERLI